MGPLAWPERESNLEEAGIEGDARMGGVANPLALLEDTERLSVPRKDDVGGVGFWSGEERRELRAGEAGTERGTLCWRTRGDGEALLSDQGGSEDSCDKPNEDKSQLQRVGGLQERVEEGPRLTSSTKLSFLGARLPPLIMISSSSSSSSASSSLAVGSRAASLPPPPKEGLDMLSRSDDEG